MSPKKILPHLESSTQRLCFLTDLLDLFNVKSSAPLLVESLEETLLKAKEMEIGLEGKVVFVIDYQKLKHILLGELQYLCEMTTPAHGAINEEDISKHTTVYPSPFS